MYIVLNSFCDKQDNMRLYKPGDIYPAEGVKVSKSRLNELSHRHPVTGKVYIEKLPEHPAGDEGEGLSAVTGEDEGEGEGSATGED